MMGRSEEVFEKKAFSVFPIGHGAKSIFFYQWGPLSTHIGFFPSYKQTFYLLLCYTASLSEPHRDTNTLLPIIVFFADDSNP